MAFSIHRSALVLHSSERMFNLVNDVNAYPSFLPWCKEAKVIDQDDHQMVATLGLSKGALKHKFTTKNHLQAPNQISIELVDGPFSRLKGNWQFVALEQMACKVMLTLEFEFKTVMGKLALEQMFQQAANNLVDAFCARADQVYNP
jgi:ribosome-associated toxin RatA of RatAB toxin-antitoxin module